MTSRGIVYVKWNGERIVNPETGFFGKSLVVVDSGAAFTVVGTATQPERVIEKPAFDPAVDAGLAIPPGEIQSGNQPWHLLRLVSEPQAAFKWHAVFCLESDVRLG